MTELTEERVRELRERHSTFASREGTGFDWARDIVALCDFWLRQSSRGECKRCGGSRVVPVPQTSAVDSNDGMRCPDCANKGETPATGVSDDQLRFMSSVSNADIRAGTRSTVLPEYVKSISDELLTARAEIVALQHDISVLRDECRKSDEAAEGWRRQFCDALERASQLEAQTRSYLSALTGVAHVKIDAMDSPQCLSERLLAVKQIAQHAIDYYPPPEQNTGNAEGRG